MDDHRFSHTRIGPLLAAMIAALVLTASGRAQLLDDFSDGNDDGWTRFTVPPDLPWASWDASTYVYRLSVDDTKGLTPEGSAVASILDLTDDPEFWNGYWWATVVRETGNSTTVLFMRGGFEPTRAYLFGWRPDTGLFIGRVDGASITILAIDPTFVQYVGTEYVLEAGAIGSDLELRMWLPGQDRPEFPQVSTTDYYYASGANGIVAQAYSDGDLSATFDDVSFAPPCPADVNSDDTVDIDDVFAVLYAWGPCEGCPEDINYDGVVDIDDVFEVLADWGPCP
ncbi:MAG: hypothetical protein JSV91_10070 [Phycisphaerales bacterium]|nr:MAG: hypothetical protein JSV91_10070 [Phycisphaerales bacterium]